MMPAALNARTVALIIIAITAVMWMLSLKVDNNVTREEKVLSPKSDANVNLDSSKFDKPGPTMTVERSSKHGESQTSPRPPQMAKVMKIYDLQPLDTFRPGDYYYFTECPYNRCTFTADPLEADLMMFDSMKMKDTVLPPRKPGALLLAYTMLPPTTKRLHHVNHPEFQNLVNWTRSTFSDSTFRAHYASIRGKSPPFRNYDAIFDEKKLQVAWFVSNCETQSRREEYVARLSKKIQVDIFGKCSNRMCGKSGYDMGGQRTECLRLLSRNYKFYISFENSLCTDYVTEIFYNMYDNVDIVPIVRGGANYSEFVPKETFIDTKDFNSPEELGDYLVALSKDKRRYTEMLRVKDYYETIPPTDHFYCTLCEALHTKQQVTSIYQDYYKWMMNHCWEPKDL